MIDKNGGIIAQIARGGAAVSMARSSRIVRRRADGAAAFGGGQTGWRLRWRRGRQPWQEGRSPRMPGRDSRFQLDEAAKEAPFLIEAMWSDRFFTYIRTNAQTRIYMSTGLSATVVPITRTEDPNLLWCRVGCAWGDSCGLAMK